MSINKPSQALMATSIILAAFTLPIAAHASRWQQILQQGASMARRGIQYHQGQSGYSSEGSGSYSAPTPPPVDHAGSPQSPGSNYYNSDPSTMRNPLKRDDPAPSQPAETPPSGSYSHVPSYSHTPRSAYRTGADDTDQQSSPRMPAYTPNANSRIRLHATHVTRPVERVERVRPVAVVVHKESKPVVEKPEYLKPATTFDTSWITPTIERIEDKLKRAKG